MGHFTRHLVAAGALASLALSLAALPLAAAAQPAATLADAWLAHQQAHPGPISWSHSAALSHETAAALGFKRQRLIAEIDNLALHRRVQGDALASAGLAEWQASLAEMDDRAARSPGRHDLPWLAANLRHNPPQSRFARLGSCEIPGWVEVWSAAGVSRHAWQPELTPRQLLRELPQAAYSHADEVVTITPLGDSHAAPVAAWNHQPLPLAPGSRLVVPLAAGVDDAAFVSELLAELLATRLPGDDCTMTDLGTP
ncbi:hypothetical protein BWR19_10185 [Halomonas sp. 1513]|nr:capsule biosynthesis GfcC family protein [Halomonas sp. 1513]APX93267.1 hypothetical protein BWR19_10185 [Halomonas sp. 1513]